MTVYIDDAEIPFGRMKMSHMMADELEELHAFAKKIGLRRSWFQNKSVAHYDVSKGKRLEAIAAGAVEVSWDAEVRGSNKFKIFMRRQRRLQRERNSGKEM